MKQTIGIGTTANDGTGDPLRTAFTKVNENTTEIYDAVADGVTDVAAAQAAAAAAAAAAATAQTGVTTNGTAITALQAADITITAAVAAAQSGVNTNGTAITALQTADTTLTAAAATAQTTANSAAAAAAAAQTTANSGVSAAAAAQTTANSAATAAATAQTGVNTNGTAITALQAADTATAAVDTTQNARLTALEVASTRLAYVTVDQTSIGTAYADIADLTFSVAANTTYSFEFNIFADADATTTGIDVAVNGPASPAKLNYAQGGYSTTTFYLETPATAYNFDSVRTGSAGANARNYRCYGVISTGAAAGNLTARIKREAVGTGPNVRAGSWGRISKLF